MGNSYKTKVQPAIAGIKQVFEKMNSYMQPLKTAVATEAGTSALLLPRLEHINSLDDTCLSTTSCTPQTAR